MRSGRARPGKRRTLLKIPPYQGTQAQKYQHTRSRIHSEARTPKTRPPHMATNMPHRSAVQIKRKEKETPFEGAVDQKNSNIHCHTKDEVPNRERFNRRCSQTPRKRFFYRLLWKVDFTANRACPYLTHAPKIFTNKQKN